MNCNLEISLNSLICPYCHNGGSYSEHFELQYRQEWNKCTSCGYMELKSVTKARILNKLDSSQLTKPFKDPIFDIENKITCMCTKCKNI